MGRRRGGGAVPGGSRAFSRFGGELTGSMRTAIQDPQASFIEPTAQGLTAYTDQLLLDHPELNRATAVADAVVAVGRFCELVLS